jgi:DNA-binding response OmpR family regulator
MYENYKVLFVDDDEHILASIKRCLIEEHFKSYFVSSGQAALDLMEKIKIDVIVTDMRMPDMNGLQLLQIVSEKWPMVVKNVLTGFSHATQILATINQINLFKFMTKPWINDELILMLHRSLDIAKLLEDNERYKNMLEMQNKTFKNVLKESEEAIAFTRNSIKVLQAFVKALIPFGHELPLLQKLKSSIVFSIKGELFDSFSNAVANNTSELTADELTELLKKHIESLNPDAVISCLADPGHKLSLNIKILEAVLYAIHLLFGEELKTTGVAVRLGPLKAGSYTVLIQSMVQGVDTAGGSDMPELLETKQKLFVSCYQEALSLCQISLDSMLSGQGIVIALSMNPLNGGAQKP